MPRELYTDGLNSAAHVGLGFVGGKAMLIPFLAYQYLIKPDHNSTVDTVEYLAGWGLSAMFGETGMYPSGLSDFWSDAASAISLGLYRPGSPAPAQPVSPASDPVLMQAINAGGVTTPGGITLVPGTCFADCYINQGDETACIHQCTGPDTGATKTVLGSYVLGSLFGKPSSDPTGLPDISTWLPIIAIVAAFFLLRK